MIKLLENKFIRFLLVGGLNTLFGYLGFAILLYIGLHYSVAVLIATVLGVLFNFKTTGILVFKNSDNKLIFKFAGVYALTYFLNVGFLGVFDLFKFNMYYAGALLLLPMAIIGFILNKRFVFEG